VVVALETREDSVLRIRDGAEKAGCDVAACGRVEDMLELPVATHDRIQALFADAALLNNGSLEHLLRCFPLTPCFLLVDETDAVAEPSTEAVAREDSVILGRLTRPLEENALRRALGAAAHFAARRDEAFERHVFRNLPLFLEEPIARVIHDLNNQITGLKGGVDLLNYSIESRNDAGEDDKTRRYMDQFILPSLSQIENLIMTWRRMRESHAEKVGPTDLATVVRRAIRLAAAPGEWGNIWLRTGDREQPFRRLDANSGDEPLVWCLGNKRNLVTAIAHILRNAIEATANREEPHIVIAFGKSAEDTVFVRVEDNGPGIDPELKSDVWRSFFSTKNQFGLGLSLAKQVVDRLQGQVELAESSRG